MKKKVIIIILIIFAVVAAAGAIIAVSSPFPEDAEKQKFKTETQAKNLFWMKKRKQLSLKVFLKQILVFQALEFLLRDISIR